MRNKEEDEDEAEEEEAVEDDEVKCEPGLMIPLVVWDMRSCIQDCPCKFEETCPGTCPAQGQIWG
jgi:hypothetical protein